jgi:hypothetical protein
VKIIAARLRHNPVRSWSRTTVNTTSLASDRDPAAPALRSSSSTIRPSCYFLSFSFLLDNLARFTQSCGS